MARPDWSHTSIHQASGRLRLVDQFAKAGQAKIVLARALDGTVPNGDDKAILVGNGHMWRLRRGPGAIPVGVLVTVVSG
jgi:hypothetical protein